MRANADRSDGWLGPALAAAAFCGLLLAWPRGYWAIAAAVCAFAGVGVAWAIAARKPRLDWRYIPVALMAVWPVIQGARGWTANPALTARAAIYWGAGGVAFVLGSEILRAREVRDRFLKLVLGGSVVLAVLAVIQKFASPGEVFGVFDAASSVFGTFFYQNQFAAFLEIAAPLALWRILRGDAVYGGTCYAILFGAAIATGSRAGIALILVELLIFLVVAVSAGRFSARTSMAAAGTILALAAIAAAVVGTDPIWQKLEKGLPETIRLDLSLSTLKMIEARPWLGYGMGAWRPVYPQYATFDLAVIANEAHDDWVQWAAEGGIPFALLMAVLGVSLVRPAVKSVWGLGFPIVLAHSFVDYVLREPAVAFLWFAVGGALCQFSRGPEERATERRA